MRYGDVCTGISAPTVAWAPLGWKAQFFSEIEPFPCRLLKYYYPDVPNLGDMLKIEQNEIFQKSVIDVLVGGTPCQSFSLAGLRGGLADGRGNLSLEYCRILIAKRPRWFVWENVPGVFSSFSIEKGSKIYNGDNIGGYGDGEYYDCTETADFATLLAGFQECGYSCCWRVFDAQYFGVPQRRRRVFVVGYLGNDWRPPFAVLFERESLRRDITPGRESGQITAGTLESRSSGGGFPGTDGAISNHIVPAYVMATGQAGAEILKDLSASLTCNHETQILFSIQPTNSGKNYRAKAAPYTQALTTNGNQSGNQSGNQGGDYILKGNMVRRLTPLECERLQGFPDYYTAIPGAKDGPRYKSLGNSMPIPVIRWIGQRIDTVEKLLNSLK